MSILIKGMEMPKSCYKCPLRRRDGMDIVCPVAHERFSVADVNILEYRLNNCPLVPVLPHGDLIDRDALCEGRVSNDNVVICAKCAPTIIPADPAEEGE